MPRRLALVALALAALALAPGARAQAPAGTSPMVDEAVRAAERAQQADKERVDRMSDEAARAAEGVPSGAETVGSTAAPAQAQAAGRGSAAAGPGTGLSAGALIGREVADREGRPVGKVADVLIAAEGGGTMVLLDPGDGRVRGVNAARVLAGEGGGYRVDLDRAGVEALPGFARDGDLWRMRE